MYIYYVNYANILDFKDITMKTLREKDLHKSYFLENNLYFVVVLYISLCISLSI